jgi:hypothetical protein
MPAGMPLFGRASPEDREDGLIGEFWAWWAGARPRVEAAIASGSLQPPVGDEITARVCSVNDGLAWEVGRGLAAEHQLCLTGEGDIELRVLTERWWRSGPPADRTWEFWPARQATPAGAGLVLAIDGASIDLDDLQFATRTDVERERLDVTIWHPAFATMDERLRTNVAFHALDGLLGEDEVQRWLGAVTTTAARAAADMVDQAGLLATIARLAADATGERFLLGRASSKRGETLSVLLNTSLKQIDHLDKPDRVRMIVSLRSTGAGGLPTAEEDQLLNALEDRVSAIDLGAVYAGRVTGRGQRTLNWYAADGRRTGAAIAEATRGQPWRIDVRTNPDLRWDGLRHRLLD